MDAPVHFTTASDGTQIAYSVAGTGSPVVVFQDFWSHAQLFWEHPITRPPLEHLAEGHTVIVVDLPGCGLSDPEPGWLSAERLGDVIASVISALGHDRVSFVAVAHIGLALIQLAVERPELIDRLGLFCPYASGPEYFQRPVTRAFGQSQRADWDTGRDATLAIGAGTDLTQDQIASHSALTDRALTPQTFFRYWGFFSHLDVSSRLREVRAPTLIVNRADNRLHPPELGRAVAAGVPDAEFKVLPGRSLAFDDPPSAIPLFLEFLAAGDAGGGGVGTKADSGPFRTILFTDVVASTPLLSQLKDERMRAIMRDHDAVLQAAVDEHDGRVVKTIGDAFMAEFAVPSAAVECAIAMQRGIRAQFADSDVPIRLRIGINAGEPIAEDDDLHGASVVIAKRLESAAATDGILVSDVVKQMVTGKDFTFADQGEVDLKGFEDPVRAWAVAWEADA